MQNKGPKKPPAPRSGYAADHGGRVIIDANRYPRENALVLGLALAATGEVYGAEGWGGGLIWNRDGNPVEVRTGKDLAPLLTDTIDVDFIRDGKLAGHVVSDSYLDLLMRSKSLLASLPILDAVTAIPGFSHQFELLRPGFNDGPPGLRLLLHGYGFEPATETVCIPQFLDVMQFSSEADRTNAVGAAVTVLLRHFWPGNKPMICALADKSQAGKDTILDFATGLVPHLPLSYDPADWPLERNIAALVASSPGVGVLRLENVRLDGRKKVISSPFLERFLTTPRPTLYSTGSGRRYPVWNHFVVGLSTNQGRLSEDLLNRSLPILLSPEGDVAARKSKIGNPRHEFLPQHRQQIHAELLAMVMRWKSAGMPLDTNVEHPFLSWAQTVGGILQVNGFQDFLANFQQHRLQNDPEREAVGCLGLRAHGQWRRPAEWVQLAVTAGVFEILVPKEFRGSEDRKAMAIGKVLKRYCLEPLLVRTDDVSVRLTLATTRMRLEPGQEGKTVYRFDCSSD